MVHRSNILLIGEDDAGPERAYRTELSAKGYVVDRATADTAPRTPSADTPVDVIVLELLTSSAEAATDIYLDHVRRIVGTEGERTIPVLALCATDLMAASLAAAEVDEVMQPPFSGAHIAGRIAALTRLGTMRLELARRLDTFARYGLDAPDISPPLPDRETAILVVGTGRNLPVIEQAMARSADIVGALTRDHAEIYLSQREFDQLILDMPAAECADFVSHLRRNSRYYSLPVLVLLEPAQAGCAGELYEAGASDVLSAPVEAIELAAKSSAQVIEHRFMEKLRAIYRHARHTATGDSLTGLFSRGFLLQHLDRLLQDTGRWGDPVTLVALSITNLADLNRQHGYAVGDRIIRQTGALLGRLLRGEDMTARWKGGHFIVVLTSTGPRDAEAAIDRLRGVINNTMFAVEGCDEPVAVQVETRLVSATPADRPETLVRRALAEDRG